MAGICIGSCSIPMRHSSAACKSVLDFSSVLLECAALSSGCPGLRPLPWVSACVAATRARACLACFTALVLSSCV